MRESLTTLIISCFTAFALAAVPQPPVLSPVGGVVYDLLNSDEDVIVQATVMGDGDRSMSSYATPWGNY